MPCVIVTAFFLDEYLNRIVTIKNNNLTAKGIFEIKLYSHSSKVPKHPDKIHPKAARGCQLASSKPLTDLLSVLERTTVRLRDAGAIK